MQRRELIKLPLFTGLLALIPKFSYAKGIKLRCDIWNGFNFQKDKKSPIGHLTALTISKKKLNNDLTVQDPTKIDAKPSEEVVGIIGAMRWDGGFADPIVFTCQISKTSREILAMLMHTELSNTEVEFAFNLYEFDSDTTSPKYYRSFHTDNKPIKGIIEKYDGTLEFEIDFESSQEVPSPRNYELYLSVMPNDTEAQQLHLAVSDTAKYVKVWGISAK